MEMKYLVAIFCALLIFGGLYFKFLYDVPDGEETTNSWVSWLLVILGVIGFLVSSLWKKRNPLEISGRYDSDLGFDKDKIGNNSSNLSDPKFSTDFVDKKRDSKL